MPRQLHNRGDRLVFSNGIILLALAAIGLIILFDAELTRLIQLYIIGVFVSFTLSQTGMVRHWRTVLADRAAVTGARPGTAPLPGDQRGRRGADRAGPDHRPDHQIPARRLARGDRHAAAVPGDGGIHRHYGRLDRGVGGRPRRTALGAGREPCGCWSPLHAPTLKALGYARAIASRPRWQALTVAVDPGDVRELREQWAAHDIDVPLQVLDSPYRDFTGR